MTPQFPTLPRARVNFKCTAAAKFYRLHRSWAIAFLPSLRRSFANLAGCRSGKSVWWSCASFPNGPSLSQAHTSARRSRGCCAEVHEVRGKRSLYVYRNIGKRFQTFTLLYSRAPRRGIGARSFLSTFPIQSRWHPRPDALVSRPMSAEICCLPGRCHEGNVACPRSCVGEDFDPAVFSECGWGRRADFFAHFLNGGPFTGAFQPSLLPLFPAAPFGNAAWIRPAFPRCVWPETSFIIFHNGVIRKNRFALIK